MKLSITLLLASMCISVAMSQYTPQPGVWIDGNVREVIDGDTYKIHHWGITYSCRLKNIDSPELNQNWGKNAKDSVSKLILSKSIKFMIIGEDLYRRKVIKLKVVTCHDCQPEFLESIILTKGWGWSIAERPSRSLQWSAPAQYQEQSNEYNEMYNAEHDARQQSRGLWSSNCTIMRPSDFRKLSKNSKVSINNTCI
jgi:endonuclease YncB( thermonuclease family)